MRRRRISPAGHIWLAIITEIAAERMRRFSVTLYAQRIKHLIAAATEENR